VFCKGGEDTSSPFSHDMESEQHYLTIMGVGNILLADEGFGVHFVRHLQEAFTYSEGVRLIDGGVLAYSLLDEICSCEHLIVIDAIKLMDLPGSIYRFTREELETRLPPPTSAHEVTFPDVLFKAELLGELPSVIFLCIIPQQYEQMSLEMTPLMTKRLPAMEGLLLEELARLNVSWWKKNDA
jgi:hydrogenase maturation protease